MKNIAKAERPKSAGAMLPPRPLRGSEKVVQTTFRPERRESNSCIPTPNQTFADSRILKISKFRTFRIAAVGGNPADAEQRLAVGAAVAFLHRALVGQKRRALHEEHREGRKTEIGGRNVAAPPLARVGKSRTDDL